ncbi:MAG TPA: MFS transporter [Polyangiaceae bacterium]|jgi:sugar phosphate permease|nr:MFS transporter [Polyangiaceae bacterium]
MAESRRDRYTAWGLSWVAYASYYFGRKGFSVVKSTLRHALGVSEYALGSIDTLYLAAYALGQFASGYFGDRVGARRLVGYGMLASAAACAAFGATNFALAFGALFFLNGFAQSTGWPGTTRAMAEWTTPQNRGTVMAFWCTCYQVGSIVATDLSAYMLHRDGWRAAFFGPAACMVAVALAILLFLKPGPRTASDEAALLDAHSSQRERRVAAQRATYKNPTLWAFGTSYFFIKYVRYALLFWLPYYLTTALGYEPDHAAYVSNAFEAGGIVGVIAIGAYSDRARHLSRASVSIFSLLGLVLALIACANAGRHTALIVVALALVGAFLYGPDALLSGAAAQDIGGNEAAATATGFVNGVGSLGGMLEGLTLPAISNYFGWKAMFPLLAGLALCAALSLLPARLKADVRA